MTTPKLLHRYFLLAAFAGLLSACVTTPQKLTPEARQKITKIAVISVVGQFFSRQYTGFTVFNNEYEGYDIGSLQLDEEYENQIQSTIATIGSYAIVRAPQYRADVNGVLNRSGLRSELSPAGKDVVKAIAREKNVDTVLILSGDTTGDFLARTPERFSGAGTYAVFKPGLSNSVLHLISAVHLIDGKTGDILASSPVLRQNQNMPSTMKRIFAPGRSVTLEEVPPYVSFDATLTRTPMQQWKPEDFQRIRKSLIELPKPYWEPTLRRLILNENSVKTQGEPQQP